MSKQCNILLTISNFYTVYLLRKIYKKKSVPFKQPRLHRAKNVRRNSFGYGSGELKIMHTKTV